MALLLQHKSNEARRCLLYKLGLHNGTWEEQRLRGIIYSVIGCVWLFNRKIKMCM